MTTPFAITVPANNVTLRANRQGEVSFTVTNTSQRPLRGRARVIPLQGASAAWFTLVGEPEREFNAASTQQFTVQVQIPSTAPAGSYLFRLDVLDVDNPDEHLAEGPPVALVTPTPLVTKKPFPVWVVLVVVALVIVGLLAGLFLNREEEPPADTSNPIPTRNIPNPIRTIRPLPTLSPFSWLPLPGTTDDEGQWTAKEEAGLRRCRLEQNRIWGCSLLNPVVSAGKPKRTPAKMTARLRSLDIIGNRQDSQDLQEWISSC